MMHAFTKTALVAVALIGSSPAVAKTLTLNFDEINTDMAVVELGGYYSASHGITFTHGALVAADLDNEDNNLVVLNDLNATQPQLDVYMNVPTGFVGGITFSYLHNRQAVANVYAFTGTDGTGDEILSKTLSDDPGVDSVWQTIHLDFNGQTAKSLYFGVMTGDVILDNIVFDVDPSPVTTGAVPEPASWALMLGGFGLVGGALRSRRRNAAVTFA